MLSVLFVASLTHCSSASGDLRCLHIFFWSANPVLSFSFLGATRQGPAKMLPSLAGFKRSIARLSRPKISSSSSMTNTERQSETISDARSNTTSGLQSETIPEPQLCETCAAIPLSELSKKTTKGPSWRERDHIPGLLSFKLRKSSRVLDEKSCALCCLVTKIFALALTAEAVEELKVREADINLVQQVMRGRHMGCYMSSSRQDWIFSMLTVTN